MNLIEKLKKTVIYRIYIDLYGYLYRKKEIRKYRNKLHFPDRKNRRLVFLIGMAEYNNMGDIAISYASQKYLRNIYGDSLVCLTENEFLANRTYVSGYISEADILILQGGGNISNLYPDQQKIRKKVIQSFQRNCIVIFPQSVYFTDDSSGCKEMKRTMKLYSGHSKLYIMAREKNTYNFFKKHISDNRLLLVPDIVFTLSQTNQELKDRTNITVILRNDSEKKADINYADISRRITALGYEEYSVRKYDTVIDHNVHKAEYENSINEIMSVFMSSRLVITDRLHAMIFSYIANTPCIAIDNITGKVSNSYEWIKSWNRIRLLNDKQSIDKVLREMLDIDIYQGDDKADLSALFDSLKVFLLHGGDL